MTAYIENLCYLTGFQVKDASYHLFLNPGAKLSRAKSKGLRLKNLDLCVCFISHGVIILSAYVTSGRNENNPSAPTTAPSSVNSELMSPIKAII